MRVFMTCLATETTTGLSVVLQTLRRLAQAGGDEVVESISAFAQLAGKTVRAVYERLRDEILTDLRSAGEIDWCSTTDGSGRRAPSRRAP